MQKTMNIKARLERLEASAALNGVPETIVHIVDTDEEAAELARSLDNRSLHIIRRSYTNEIRLQDLVGNFNGLMRDLDGIGPRIPTARQGE
jgi:hypothetical protein